MIVTRWTAAVNEIGADAGRMGKAAPIDNGVSIDSTVAIDNVVAVADVNAASKWRRALPDELLLGNTHPKNMWTRGASMDWVATTARGSTTAVGSPIRPAARGRRAVQYYRWLPSPGRWRRRGQ